MEKDPPSTLDDLRIPPTWIAVALTFLGIWFGFYVAVAPQVPAQLKLFVIVALITGSLSWLIAISNPRFGAYFLVTGLTLLVYFAAAWFQIPATLMLLSITIWLEVAMIGWQIALGTALVNTCLVIMLSWTGTIQLDSTSLWLTFFSIWSALGLVLAVQLPTRRVAAWTATYYENARTRLVEAQDRQVELSQALDDLMHANGQLAMLNERIANYRQAAEEARRSKEIFVARVSHEFRAPLNIIIGTASLMVDSAQAYDSPLPPRAMQQLEVINRSCHHLTSMINDVLDLSQSEGGRLVLHREMVDLIEVVDSALAIVRPLIEGKGIDLQTDYPDDMPLVNCDRLRIRQVILNLLSNAARYTEKGVISVKMHRDEENVSLRITDTGPGISVEDSKRIFEPFSQVGKDISHMQGGSGLGLSISKQFIDLHEGSIGVDSQLGQGSTFWLKLPLSTPSQPVTRPGQWISDKWVWVERRSSSDHPPMVLKPRVVVCDETGFLYPTLLHSHEEYDLVDTRSLNQALDELRKTPAASLVLNLPHYGNLDIILSRLQKEAPETPVVCSSFPRRIDDAKRAGAEGFILKPLTSPTLDRVLDSLDRKFDCILVVDDDEDTRVMMSQLIHLYDHDINVLLAGDGETALRVMRDNRPDLVLLDVIMPGLNGWEVLSLKQKEALIKNTPVIMVSAQDMQTGVPNSAFLLATIGDGVSAGKLVEGLSFLPKLMLKPG